MGGALISTQFVYVAKLSLFPNSTHCELLSLLSPQVFPRELSVFLTAELFVETLSVVGRCPVGWFLLEEGVSSTPTTDCTTGTTDMVVIQVVVLWW